MSDQQKRGEVVTCMSMPCDRQVVEERPRFLVMQRRGHSRNLHFRSAEQVKCQLIHGIAHCAIPWLEV